MPPRISPKQKIRLDTLLVTRALASSITHAQALILSGVVLVEDRVCDKPGTLVKENAAIRLREKKSHGWVSRGGVKLAHGIAHFAVSPEGKIAADIGASTGGFTDVLLHHGARKIYAVDVGYSELAWRLRQDARVVVLERTNARDLTRAIIPDPLEWIVCDASFISMKKVLSAVLELALPGAQLISLIKPQFEVAAHEVGEGGIIRDVQLHQRVCDEISVWLSESGWNVQGMCESPIKGAEGNTEFLIGAQKHGS